MRGVGTRVRAAWRAARHTRSTPPRTGADPHTGTPSGEHRTPVADLGPPGGPPPRPVDTAAGAADGTGGTLSWKAGSTAAAVLAALGVFVAACSTGGTGTRDEGPARTDTVSQTSPTAPAPSPAPKRVNAVRLLLDDPEVSATVKDGLRPCTGDEYPVDVIYGSLTGVTSTDVVVNVLSCEDAVGLGSYVYRPQGSAYENVFRSEEPPVYAEIDRGDLVVTQQVYADKDPVAFPSGEDVVTYRWATAADAFTERARTHNDYGNAAAGATAAPDN